MVRPSLAYVSALKMINYTLWFKLLVDLIPLTLELLGSFFFTSVLEYMPPQEILNCLGPFFFTLLLVVHR
jgi:hypothetical protein